MQQAPVSTWHCNRLFRMEGKWLQEFLCWHQLGYCFVASHCVLLSSSHQASDGNTHPPSLCVWWWGVSGYSASAMQRVCHEGTVRAGPAGGTCSSCPQDATHWFAFSLCTERHIWVANNSGHFPSVWL